MPGVVSGGVKRRIGTAMSAARQQQRGRQLGISTGWMEGQQRGVQHQALRGGRRGRHTRAAVGGYSENIYFAATFLRPVCNFLGRSEPANYSHTEQPESLPCC